MARLQLHLLTVFGTHVHTGACPTAAVFLQVPGLAPTLHALPPEHTVPRGLLTQVPVVTKPILCSSPGKPLSWEQVPA
jgi:hypothetical protein